MTKFPNFPAYNVDLSSCKTSFHSWPCRQEAGKA